MAGISEQQTSLGQAPCRVICVQLKAAVAESAAITALLKSDAAVKPPKADPDLSSTPQERKSYKERDGGNGGGGAFAAAAPPDKAVLPRKRKLATKLQRDQTEDADVSTEPQPVAKTQQQVSLWLSIGSAAGQGPCCPLLRPNVVLVDAGELALHVCCRSGTWRWHWMSVHCKTASTQTCYFVEPHIHALSAPSLGQMCRLEASCGAPKSWGYSLYRKGGDMCKLPAVCSLRPPWKKLRILCSNIKYP